MTIRRSQEGFKDPLYVALRNVPGAGALFAQARRLGLPTVVAHPVYYQTPEQARLQKTLTAIRLNQTVTTIRPCPSKFLVHAPTDH